MLFMRSRDMRGLVEFLTEGGGCLVPLVLFIAFIALLASMVRAITLVETENRTIEPAQVWLCIIPVINLIWLPVVVDRVGDSIKNELLARGIAKKKEGYAKSAGFIGLFLIWVSLLFPYIGALFFVFALIYAVVYWVLINGYSRRLKDTAGDDFHSAAQADEGW